MKRFFTKTGIWLLAAAATIAVALCIVSALGSGTGFLHDALGVIASPFRTAGTAVADWFTAIGDRFESVEQLQEKNAELNRRVAELEDELRKAQNAADENKNLRQLLGLRQQRTDLQFEAARVTQRDVSNWASTVVLNRGSQHGVAVGNCAVDSSGNLAGVVTDVVHDIDVGDLDPAVQLHGLFVALGRIAAAVIGGVALHYGSADVIYGGLHEVRAQEVLVSRLAAVQLHGDIALELYTERFICLNNVLGAYILNKIHL